jgi:hypothetical protein
MSERVVGLDLGQANDPAAAAVLDRVRGREVTQHDERWGLWDNDVEAWVGTDGKTWRQGTGLMPLHPSRGHCEMWMREHKLLEVRGQLLCRSLRLWPTPTDYNVIVDDVTSLPYDVLVPDFCGVGRPVVDMLRKAAAEKRHKGKIYPVATVASSARAHARVDTRGHASHSVPKIELVTSIQVVQQDKRLVLPDSPETGMLLGQLADYQMRYSKAGNVQFGNVERAGKHDDLVSALGLACWFALRFGTRKLAVHV